MCVKRQKNKKKSFERIIVGKKNFVKINRTMLNGILFDSYMYFVLVSLPLSHIYYIVQYFSKSLWRLQSEETKP